MPPCHPPRFRLSGMSAAETLDARGLLCPLPVIRTQDRIKSLPPGTIVEVLATDVGTLHDIPAWCRVHGHEVLSMMDQDGVNLDPAGDEAGTAPQGIKAGSEICIRLRVGA